MTTAFDTAILGATGRPVRRLGLSASYWPGKKTIYEAVDCGVTLFFAYGFDFQMIRALRNLFRTGRDRFVVVTGAYNLIWTHTDVRKSCEKRLRQLGTDYLDYFLFLGVMKPREFPARVQEDLLRLREEGKVRGVGVSCHDRRFAGQLIAEGRVDTLMMRYSAAHRGAETDIFPHVAAHHPTVISYTATRWRQLLRRPRGWPADRPIPTAPQCYRFVLSHPCVDVALTAPSNAAQLRQNLLALEQGPLADEEMAFMREFGDVVHGRRPWFM
ncbi:MAG TPA: aldo/keto reductase [candidate division Zixibacteria bacterium]|nr:aldo/keto reductase [candidate division Zixibacteria bacterium]MDD4918555.1 aldo/keto reductase [candidate division Zixibacteria bacterium]MDM7971948.1 aldo/keto reductase [candidate division Zixibacteria bacterium]HOD65615.1 aldo/keto reductase [candidate division Zixibacteria bacterium]HPC11069.1 aldo/keto reductase [candidate division Zixibacteria bacterium]